MRRLNNEVLDAVCNRAVERLGHVVDLLAVTLVYMVDDDLAGEAAANRVVRERLLHRGLDGADGLAAAVVVAGAEADYQQLVFADFVLIERIIQACVTRFVVFFVVCRGIGCSGVRALGVLGGVVCSRLAAAGGQSRHHQACGEQQSAQFLEFHEKVPPFFGSSGKRTGEKP